MAKYKQVDLLEEQESFVSIDYLLKEVTVYSNRATVMNRMDRLGYKPTREFLELDGTVGGAEWVFPTSMIGKFLRTGIFGYNSDDGAGLASEE